MDNNRLLRPEEAASLLGISESTLRRWTRRGLIPAVVLKSGVRSVTRWRSEALQQYMADAERTATPWQR